MMKKITTILLLSVLFISACSSGDSEEKETTTTSSGDNISIVLNGNSITSDSDQVTVDGSTATITAAGTYEVSGELDDGQIRVDVGDNDEVTLILNGATIHNEDSAAIYVVNADTTTISLAEGSNNTLSDGNEYALDNVDEEPDATLFSHDDLVISGSGTLNINAAYGDAIASKDDLEIYDATINIDANDDGIRGKDSITVENATLNITAVADAMKSTNDSDTEKGYILIESGAFTITTTGSTESSSKGIKAYTSITINGGTFNIDSSDDSIHAADITITGGEYTLASGDDGIHADNILDISAGTINITDSYEGLEAADLRISGGTIDIVSKDDGINAAGGTDTTTSSGRQGDMFSTSSGTLTISGGTITVDAEGDGIDVNGDATMSGGTITVHGPASGGNGALDYDGTFEVTGGTLIAVGMSDMAQGTSGSQNSAMISLTSTYTSGSKVRIVSSDGSEIMSYTAIKNFQSIVFSDEQLTANVSYTVYIDDEEYTTFTASSGSTQVGTSGGMMPGGDQGQGGGGGFR